MRIAFFGSSLGAGGPAGARAYYRGVLKALGDRGHQVVFYEPDAGIPGSNPDPEETPCKQVRIYGTAGESGVARALERARNADLVVKAGGPGLFDGFLDAAVLELRGPETTVAFWDVDAQATLGRLQGNQEDPFRELVPQYDLVLTHGGGPSAIAAYTALGARVCIPIHDGLDPATHHPVPFDARFDCDFGLIADRLPEREPRIEHLFFDVAARLPAKSFLLGGRGWDDLPAGGNVRRIGEIARQDHNAFNLSARAVLAVGLDAPATRLFEAAGAGACLIADVGAADGESLESFFEPGREILVARDGDEVAAHLAALTPERARRIGTAARSRALADHSYDQRVLLLEAVLEGRVS
jgi:spore maturation protein CgeB